MRDRTTKLPARDVLNAESKDLFWKCIERQNTMAYECAEFWEFAKERFNLISAKLSACDMRNDDASFTFSDFDVYLSICQARAAFGITDQPVEVGADWLSSAIS